MTATPPVKHMADQSNEVRRRVYIGVALGLAIAALAVSVYRSEPAYQGKSLSDWIGAMNRAHTAEDRRAARAAVHQLASNSIPVLLNWLQRKERPSLKERFWEAKSGAFGWLESHRLISPKPHMVLMDWKASYRALAMDAFEELGPDGKEAIPTLIQWLGRKASTTNELDETAGAAYLVLGKLGPASIPALTTALSNQDVQAWALSAGALADIGPHARTAIPALRPRLRDTNHMTRVAAADVIGKLGGDPQEFIPVLIESVREPDDADMLGYKLDVLLRYKDYATNALPVLLDRLRSIPEPGSMADRNMRQELLHAIRQLDSAAIQAREVVR
jgi:HEAT repeats